jgi:hypothetical protein
LAVERKIVGVVLGMPLTPEQLDALPILTWFANTGSESRRSGRTYLLAVVFIRLALRNPGQRILIWDHHPTIDARSFAAQEIRDLINDDVHLRTLTWRLLPMRAPVHLSVKENRTDLYAWLPGKEPEQEPEQERKSIWDRLDEEF